MKKLIALALCMMMLATLAVGTSAAGQILFTDDFTNGFSANNWILDGNLFFLDDTGDDNCLAAYSDGVICQAEFRPEINGDAKAYTNCDYSIRMQIRDFDKDGGHAVGLWWRDDFCHTPDGGEDPWELGEVYTVVVDADEMLVKLQSSDYEEAPLATAPATDVEVGGDWFTLGWRVTPGHMCVFLNGQKVIDYTTEELAAVHPSPFLLMNTNCFAAYDDIVIADLEYNLFGDYSAGGEDTTSPVDGTTAPAGDDNADVTTKETTTATSNVQVTDKDGNDVTDESGNKVTSQVIITDPAPAATNTGKPTGGSSTATGDATFVVVAAMVATLGCAIIVKKASAR